MTITTEAPAQSRVILRAFEMGFALWRNNSGVMPGTDSNRPVRFGLGNDSKKINEVWKSPDLIGVGPQGRFMGVEMKKPGWKFSPNDKRAVAQANAINDINKRGGIAFFCTSVEEFETMMKAMTP
jgi:hypothetical protein